MTTFIDLLRHGKTENSQRYCGSTNHPLTPLGWTQMWNATDKKPPQWQQIITSPLGRCAHFAQALEQRYAIPVTQDARLQEIHFGGWENQSAADLMQIDADALSRFWQNPIRYPPPDAEHLLDFEIRVLAAWHHIIQQFNDQKILLITHSGVIRIIICHIQQHPIERLLEFEVPHAGMKHVCIDPAKHPQAMLISDPRT
ncbi:MAG: alpha-ribazole phosphatase family protein [Pseudomonadota bacterium]